MSKYKKTIALLALLACFYLITTALVILNFRPDLILKHGDRLNYASTENLNLFFVLLFFPIFIRYFLNILVSPFYAGGSAKTGGAKILRNCRPLVTVIIPARNEEVGIKNTVRSVLKNTYRRKEVIIVNDGSTDGTDQQVRQLMDRHRGSAEIIYIKKEKNQGKARALNDGLKKSRGEIIITIDADSIMLPSAIGAFVARFKNPQIMAAAGNIKIGNTSGLFGIVQTIEYLSGFYFKRADSLMNTIYIVGGTAAAYRREVFDRLGGFDEKTITEDIEMSTRMQSAKMKIAYAADAVVYTEAPSSLGDLIRQRVRWKRGRFETFYKYRSLFFNPKYNNLLTLFILPLAVFAELLLFIEAFLLLFLLRQVILAGEFTIFLVSIAVLAAVVSIQVLSEERGVKRWLLLALVPIAWILFYFIDFVEYSAQLKNVWTLIKKKKIKWQEWQRAGVFQANR